MQVQQKNYKISVVVPVFNRAKIVAKTLDSIAEQASQQVPVKLIIVDNGSTDSSREVLHDWKHRNESDILHIEILTELTPGAAAARQCGLNRVETEWVVFFDSDDIMPPATLREYLDMAREHPAADIVCGRCLFIDFDGSRRFFRSKSSKPLIDQFHHSILHTPAYAVRTEFIRKAGGWNTNLRIWDDWELGLRLLMLNPQIVFTDHVVVNIIRQHDSITGDRYSDRHEHYPAVLDAVSENILRSGHRLTGKLLNMILYRRMLLAGLYRREGEKELAALTRRQTMALCRGNKRMQILLPMVYHYVARGGRGSATILQPFF